jgi:trk system potassium uptake protein TrkA
MRILVIGAGVVGANLAEQLAREGQDVSIVEADPAVARRLSDRLDVLFITGSGTSGRVLEQAGVEDCEMVVAVTNSDEVNLVCCMMARHYGVKKKVARIRNPEYSDGTCRLSLQEVGVDLVVNPEQVIVQTILQMIETPGTTDAAEFADGRILLRGFRVPRGAPIAWKKLSELREASTLDSFLIAAISRGDRLIIPHGADEVQPDDTVFVIVAEETLPLFLPFVNRRVEPVQKVVIYGATRPGLRLAGALKDKVENIILIEPEEEPAEKAAAEFSNVIVLHGEATDPEILAEAGVADAQFFVALTRDDESNMLASLLAKEKGAKRTIAVTQNPDYIDILESIGIDIVLNPRIITVGKILRFIRRGKIVSVVKLHESDAEVIEMEAVPKSRVVGRSLKDISFPEGAIVGALLQDNMMQIPDGNTVIKGGDRVVVFARPEAIPAVEKLFTRRRWL